MQAARIPAAPPAFALPEHAGTIDIAAPLREAGLVLPAGQVITVSAAHHGTLCDAVKKLVPWDAGQFLHHFLQGTDGERVSAGLALITLALPWSGLLPALAACPEPARKSAIEIAIAHLRARGANFEQRDHLGRSALHLAAELDSPELITALIRAGANTAAQDLAGNTALHLAAGAPSRAALSTLLALGVSPDPRDHAQASPLHLAAQNDDPDAVSLLLQAGARADAIDARSRKAADLARGEVCRALLSRSNNPSRPEANARRGDGIDWWHARLCGDIDLVALTDPRPIETIRSGGRLDVLVTDQPAGPGWQDWRDMAEPLRECGIAIPPGRRVFFQQRSHAIAELTRGLPLVKHARREGQSLAQAFIDGIGRKKIEALAGLMRLGLCDAHRPESVLHEMARRAVERQGGQARDTMNLDERIALLCAVFEAPRPIGVPPATRFSTPPFLRGQYVFVKDGAGHTALTHALLAGNQRMVSVLRKWMDRHPEMINDEIEPPLLPADIDWGTPARPSTSDSERTHASLSSGGRSTAALPIDIPTRRL